MESFYADEVQLVLKDIANSLNLTIPYIIVDNFLTIKLNDNLLLKIFLRDDSNISGECWSDFIYYFIFDRKLGSHIDSSRVSLGHYRIEFYHSAYCGYVVAGTDEVVSKLGETDLNNLMPNTIETLKTVMDFYS